MHGLFGRRLDPAEREHTAVERGVGRDAWHVVVLVPVGAGDDPRQAHGVEAGNGGDAFASRAEGILKRCKEQRGVLVAVGGGQSAVKIPQRAGAFFKARRVPEQENRAEAALYVGGQLGSSSHGQIGSALGLGLSVGVVESVDVEGHDHLAVAVAVFAVGSQCILQSVHGVLGQIVGSHHGHVIIGLGDKEILSDEVVGHKSRSDADDDDPFQVIVPPVGPALLAGVLSFLARGNVLRVDVALVTVACHEAVSSKKVITLPEWSGGRRQAAASARPGSCLPSGWAAAPGRIPCRGWHGCRGPRTGPVRRRWPPAPPVRRF